MDTLGEFAGWWIEARCGCGSVAYMPVKLLLQQHGPDAQVSALVARMRCKRCQARPAAADLIDSPQAGTTGYLGAHEPQRRVITPGRDDACP